MYLPSKKQDARPRVRIRRSVSTVRNTDFAGVVTEEISDGEVASW